jgi:hypothetical protein
LTQACVRLVPAFSKPSSDEICFIPVMGVSQAALGRRDGRRRSAVARMSDEAALTDRRPVMA